MFPRPAQPGEELRSQAWHSFGGWADVMDLVGAEHADLTGAVAARRIQEAGHQHLVGSQQIVLARRLPAVQRS